MDRAPLRTDEDSLSLKPLVLLTALGVGLRLFLLWLSGEPELQSDEANYVYLALMWNRFDVYFDQHRFLWPPAYTWYLGAAFETFGDRGLLAARIGQTLASASIGLTTMLFAYRLFGMRAARLAGLIWVAYLPLAVFSHLLWNETLFLAVFLPGLYQVLRVVADAGRVRVDLRLLTAGLLFAASLLLKEAPTYLVPALALTLACTAGGIGEGLRRASLLLLAVAVVLVPWGLRNQEVYGRFVFAGASLGENVYNGLNAGYRNFDLIPLDTERYRRGEEPITSEVREWFIAVDEGSQWDRAEEIPHAIERSDENVSRGLEFARARPGWLVRSRIKKLADFVTPMSFYTRHLALGHYDPSALGGSLVRKLTGTWALLGSAAVLLLGLRGLCLNLRPGRGGIVVLLTIGYVAGTSLLVAMSRFRTPIDPLLIALAAGAIVGQRNTPRPARRALAALSVAALLFLWWVNLPEVSTVVREMVWRRRPVSDARPLPIRPLPIRYLPHLFLAAVLIVEFLVGSGVHREDSELLYLADEGTTEERLWAWHVLANRSPEEFEFTDETNRGLMNDEDPLLVDYCFTIDVARLIRANDVVARQEARIRKRLRPEDARSSPDDVAEWWQRYVIYRRKVGGKTVGGQVRLRRDELRWYFDATTGRPLDEQTLVDRTNERQLRSYEVRKARIGEEGEDWPGYESGRLPPPDED